MNKRIFILMIAFLVGAQASAGSVTVPNTFVDGTTASAGEVNANFDAVESGVNDNDARITTNTSNVQTNTTAISNMPKTYYVVDSAGVIIGRLLGAEAGVIITLITESGYVVDILSLGELRDNPAPLVYTSTDCTGQAYVHAQYFNGMLVGNSNEFRYVPLDANVVLGFPVRSRRNIGSPTCDTVSTNQDSVPTNPNDPSITGIPDAGFSGRMRIKLL